MLIQQSIDAQIAILFLDKQPKVTTWTIGGRWNHSNMSIARTASMFKVERWSLSHLACAGCFEVVKCYGQALLRDPAFNGSLQLILTLQFPSSVGSTWCGTI